MTDRGVIHVDLARLDRLLNLVGELVVTRTAFAELTRRARARYGFKEQVLNLVETTDRVGRIGEEIQTNIIQSRLVPVDTVFSRFRRLVDRLSESTDKEIRLEVDGGKTEVDKRTIDELAEPLVHLVRNALDHGIEPAAERERLGKPREGLIRLTASHEGNRLVVEVTDDGGGIDAEAVLQRAVQTGVVTQAVADRLSLAQTVDLLFLPGFSTARRITEMSGRGVGMDAARRRVEELGGRLSMESQRGNGCRVRIDLPLTTAIVEALVVEVGDERYAIPLENVREIVRRRADQVSTVEGRVVLELRGEPLSLVHLADLTELPGHRAKRDRVQVVVLSHGERSIGLVVDRIAERHEIVIKGLGRRLSGIDVIAGASIGGDGRVFMVVDAAALCNSAVRVANEAGGDR